MPEVPRFHSPFSHWRSGLLAEIAAFAAFLLALAALAVAVATAL